MSNTAPLPANTPSSSKLHPSLPSVILPSITSHRRLLPTPAAHAFSYPLVYLGVDVDDLEQGRLNAGPAGLALRYGRPWSALLSVQADSYLATRPFADNDHPHAVGLRQGLLNLLSEFHSIESASVGRIWLVSMPSYVGKRAMNPLSVWFVYARSDRKLMAVVLEVHNTFGERHMYVLRTGVDELDASEVASGHHHAWHTHRNFHVSPFNDRAGYYRLDLRDPFYDLDASKNIPPEDIKFKVTLHLLTRDKKRKLFANLQNHPSSGRRPQSITAYSIIQRIVCRQPLDLLLTTPRILIQAWSLHYRKGLRVYPRPEPETADGQDGAQALPIVENSVQLPDESVDTGSSVSWLGNALGWQETGASEARCRRLVLRYLQDKADAEGIAVSISFANRSIVRMDVRPRIPPPQASEKVPLSPPDSGYASAEDDASTRSATWDHLLIRTRHPALFTQLVMSPTPAHFLASAAGDRHSVVSDAKLFERVFSGRGNASAAGSSCTAWTQSKTDAIRRTYLYWLLSFCVRPIPPDYVCSSAPHFLQIRQQSRPRECTMTTWEGLGLLYTLASVLFFDWLEERVMHLAGARFVQGMEPWGTWARAVDHMWRHHDGADAIERKGAGTAQTTLWDPSTTARAVVPRRFLHNL